MSENDAMWEHGDEMYDEGREAGAERIAELEDELKVSGRANALLKERLDEAGWQLADARARTVDRVEAIAAACDARSVHRRLWGVLRPAACFPGLREWMRGWDAYCADKS